MKITRFLYFFLLTILLTSCSYKLKYVLHEGTNPPASKEFLAGAGQRDITPHPGFAMSGFGPAGRIARGWWTRLKAKSLYFEDPQGERLVMVACDLWSIPAGLGDAVIELLQKSEDSRYHLGRAQLLLAATHTHHSQGNYSSCKAYNSLASIDMSFEKELLEFIAHNITESIKSSIDDAQKASLYLYTDTLVGLMRNRSILAFENNHDVEKQAILSRIGDVSSFLKKDRPPFVKTTDEFRAIDPYMEVLKVVHEKAPEKPIGIAAFLSVHPTVMGTPLEVYSSDIFGVAANLVEEKLLSSHGIVGPAYNPPVLMFNKTHGDISANWKKQDRKNTLDIARSLAIAIIEGVDKSKEIEFGPIKNRFKVVKIADQPIVQDFHDDFLGFAESDKKTARKASIGMATVGGAEDGRASQYFHGFREGVRSEVSSGPQGYKISGIKHFIKDVLGMKEDKIILNLAQYIAEGVVNIKDPNKIPLGVHSIGNLKFATLPGECTVTLGERIKKRLQQSDPDDQIILVGMANEYLSYFTTPREYDMQHYEGSSTIYGRATAVFLEQSLSDINALPGQLEIGKKKTKYKVMKPSKAEPLERFQNDHWDIDEGLSNLTVNEDSGSFFHNYPRFYWEEPITPWKSRDVTNSDPILPAVRIQYIDSLGNAKPLVITDPITQIPVTQTDERSNAFVTVIEKKKGSKINWCAIWMPPVDLVLNKKVKFEITTSKGKILQSESFDIEDVLGGKKDRVVRIE